ncbi:MAG TPA: hypothetical protein VNX68_12800 [Nitrosopumilaceae archaeon]|jgi:hypothetical protein|nr:hypothetical protein [Nitrosopumilaceae archaeon]
MEPTITEINLVKSLISTSTFEGNDYNSVTINQLILRPVLKRIVFTTKEFGRVAIFEGETDFNLHVSDSSDVLIQLFLNKIDTLYKK